MPDPHALDDVDVVEVLVVAVAGHLGVGALGDVARPLLRPRVPDAEGLASLVVAALNLKYSTLLCVRF